MMAGATTNIANAETERKSNQRYEQAEIKHRTPTSRQGGVVGETSPLGILGSY